MQHPFEALKPEYSYLLSVMKPRPEHVKEIDRAAAKLLGFKSRYAEVSAADGVPVVFIAASFEREGSSDFRLNPALGWPLTSVSKIIPHNGPFRTWRDAAMAAYHIDGLDRLGAAKWTWELLCFYGEFFNGFGPRNHGRHTGYLWAGTNIYEGGKYVADGVWDPNHWDTQLGIVPIARRMIELDVSLTLPTPEYVPIKPVQTNIAVSPDHPDVDVKWVQHALNQLGYHPPLREDESYGRMTKTAVEHFQKNYRLAVDGIAGPETIGGLKLALAALASPPPQA